MSSAQTHAVFFVEMGIWTIKLFDEGTPSSPVLQRTIHIYNVV